MAVLDYALQSQIDKLEDAAYEKLQANDVLASFNLREQAWELYPDPKENWNEAYNSAKYAFRSAKKVGDHDLVKKYLNRMIAVNNNLHHNDNELTFYIAEYHFDNGDYEESLNRFKIVVEDAGLRYFEKEDPRYLDFYKHPEKYME